MRSVILWSTLFVCGAGILTPADHAWSAPPPRRASNGPHPGAAPSPPQARASDEEKEQQLRLEAARELMRWLAPLSPQPGSTAGLEAVMHGIQTWVASRWGLRLKKRAWKRWIRMTRYLTTWQPAPLYRDLRFKRIHPRLTGQLKDMKFIMTAPKPSETWKGKVGTGQLAFGLTPLKRRRPRDRRPYRFTLRSNVRIKALRPKQIDTALRTILQRFTDPKLAIPLLASQQDLLKDMPNGHSRQIARWINSRVPHTAALLRRYLKVINILEPIGKGLYRLDLRARWKLKPFKRDYPRAAKALTRKNTSFQLVTEFQDPRRRRWFVWSYRRKNMEMRYQAVISKDGFWLCDDNWKPISGPWRLTQMGADWTTRTTIRYRSNQIRFTVRDFALRWRVRSTPKGATLAAEMTGKPKVQIRGGRLIRILARILISGGIQGLIQRFLNNLATGDGGRGLRWKWELAKGKQRSTLNLRVVLPIVPDSTLTTLLRLGPSLVRRGRSSHSSSKGKKRKKKRYPPMWNRLFRAIHKDLGAARALLAPHKKD